MASERWEVVPTANGEPFDPTTTSATNTNAASRSPPSGKSIWTRWWMIVIYVIVGIGVFANLFPADDEGDLTASPTTTV